MKAVIKNWKDVTLEELAIAQSVGFQAVIDGDKKEVVLWR